MSGIKIQRRGLVLPATMLVKPGVFFYCQRQSGPRYNKTVYVMGKSRKIQLPVARVDTSIVDDR